MKVHIYARDFPLGGGESRGGVSKAVAGLAGGLAERGARVTIICNGPRPGRVTSPSGYDILCFRSSDRWGLMLPAELAGYIAGADRSSIFLLNGVFSPAVYAISRACLRNGIPYVFWPHDPYHPSLFGTRTQLKWVYWHLRERRLLQDAKAIQILSPSHRDWLRKLGVETPCIELVNGYCQDDVLPRAALCWRQDGPERLLFLGRIDSHNKGLDLLLGAFARILHRTEACLTLQGPDWGDVEVLKHQARALGLPEDRVRFEGPDFDRSSAKIMMDHDAVLVPSRFEGFSLSALEAMCSARVLLVTEIAGISGHVRRAGCGVVVDADVEAIAGGLLQLLSRRSEWRSMGLAGRRYALTHFRWDKIASTILHQYVRLAEPDPRLVAARELA